jgi:PHD/YefM family antitoxin component YafN of YafNO toxin-antitoxin module
VISRIFQKIRIPAILWKTTAERAMPRIFDRVEDRPRQFDDLPAVSTTELAGAIQKVTSAVLSAGAVLVTKHDQPAMVLVSVDRYLQLTRAAEPDLGALTRRFDDMVARMQGPEAERRMAEAFAMTPAELGAAAQRAAAK